MAGADAEPHAILDAIAHAQPVRDTLIDTVKYAVASVKEVTAEADGTATPSGGAAE